MTNKNLINTLLWAIVWLILGIFITNASQEKSVYILGFIPAFIAFLYLDIYIHEFGHALSAIIVKFPINRITIGTGREILRTKIYGMSLVITTGIAGGMTAIGSVTNKNLKFRYFVFVLGGIVFQLFSICALLLFFGIFPSELLYVKQISLLHIFAYSNILLIILNIYPHNFIYSGIPVPNDGARLIKLPFLKSTDIQEILAAGKIFEAYEMFEAKQYPEAKIGFQKCVKSYPSLLIPKINLSAIYIKELRFEKTINYLESILEMHRNDQYRFFIYNNLAWAYFLLDCPQSLEKADKYSEQAIECNPHHKSILNTRGCVLIEKGDVEEGINYLKQTIKIRKPVDEKINHPISFLALAYGYYIKKKFQKATKFLNKFETYDDVLDKDGQVYFERILFKTDNFIRILEKKETA